MQPRGDDGEDNEDQCGVDGGDLVQKFFNHFYLSCILWFRFGVVLEAGFVEAGAIDVRRFHQAYGCTVADGR